MCLVVKNQFQSKVLGMKQTPRVAITGIGSGETRGHGGFIYDRIIYSLFTRNRYQDKTRQEALIATSELDWIIVRPAPSIRIFFMFPG